jgi:hypothetical protein
MAITDYNSINFRNSVVDRLTSKFGDDGPISKRQNRMMNKASQMMGATLKKAPTTKSYGIKAKEEAKAKTDAEKKS